MADEKDLTDLEKLVKRVQDGEDHEKVFDHYMSHDAGRILPLHEAEEFRDLFFRRVKEVKPSVIRESTPLSRKVFLEEGMKLKPIELADQGFSLDFKKELGDSGGQGQVSKWVSERMSPYPSEAAIKIYHKATEDFQASMSTQFLGEVLFKELQTLRGINHPNVVQVYDGFKSKIIHTVDGEERIAYFVMSLVLEFVPGVDLREWVKVKRPKGCDVQETASLIGFYADVVGSITDAIKPALDDERVRSFAHADIKPSNILGFDLESDSLNLPKSKLADFGCALPDALDNRPSDGSQIGTPGFSAPEQAIAVKNSDWTRSATSDVFSLGMTFLALLCPTEEHITGTVFEENSEWNNLRKHLKHEAIERPEENSPFASIDRRLREGHTMPAQDEVEKAFKALHLPKLVDALIPEVDFRSRELRAILKQCLQIDPAKRIQHPAELANMLARWLRYEDPRLSKSGHRSKTSLRETIGVKLTRFKQRLLHWNLPSDHIILGGAWLSLGGLPLLAETLWLLTVSHLDLMTQAICTYLVLALLFISFVGQRLYWGMIRSRIKSSRVAVFTLARWFSMQAKEAALLRFRGWPPYFFIFISYAVTWGIARFWIGSDFVSDHHPIFSSKAEGMYIGDLAQMTCVFAIFSGLWAGYSMGEESEHTLRRLGWTVKIAVFLALFSTVAIWCYSPWYSMSTIKQAESFSGVVINGYHGLFLTALWVENFVWPIFGGQRNKFVDAQFANAAVRHEVFTASTKPHTGDAHTL